MNSCACEAVARGATNWSAEIARHKCLWCDPDAMTCLAAAGCDWWQFRFREGSCGSRHGPRGHGPTSSSRTSSRRTRRYLPGRMQGALRREPPHTHAHHITIHTHYQHTYQHTPPTPPTPHTRTHTRTHTHTLILSDLAPTPPGTIRTCSEHLRG